MLIENIQLENGLALGLSFQMQKAPLIVIRADKGFVMCGYLDMEAAGALDDAAVKVRGVNTFSDVLKASVVDAAPKAIKLGIKPGMTGRQALELMF